MEAYYLCDRHPMLSLLQIMNKAASIQHLNLKKQSAFVLELFYRHLIYK